MCWLMRSDQQLSLSDSSTTCNARQSTSKYDTDDPNTNEGWLPSTRTVAAAAVAEEIRSSAATDGNKCR